MWATGDWQLHQGDVPVNASSLVQSFQAKHLITQVTQHPRIPDMVPCDFWLFQKLKAPSMRFQTIKEIEENMTGQLMVTGRTV